MKALLVSILISTTQTAASGQYTFFKDSDREILHSAQYNNLIFSAVSGIFCHTGNSDYIQKSIDDGDVSDVIHIVSDAWEANDSPSIWKLSSESKLSRYADLSGVWYTHAVHESYGFGAETYPYAAIKTGAASSWYEQWWFRFGLLIFVVAAISLIIKYRLSYLLGKAEQRKLRRQTSFQGQMIAAINHDIQTPLAYLVMSLGRVEDFLNHSSADPLMRETGRTAYLSAMQISRFTSNLLLFIKSQMIRDKDSIPVDEIQLHELVESELNFFGATIRSKELFFENSIEKGITVSSNRNMLSVIIHNLIDNAIKNTFQGGVSVVSVQTARGVDVFVKDTGTGVKNEVIEWLNLVNSDRDHPEKFELSDEIGIGLIIVKDLCDMLKIKFYVESTSEAGAKVGLSFPRPA